MAGVAAPVCTCRRAPLSARAIREPGGLWRRAALAQLEKQPANEAANPPPSPHPPSIHPLSLFSFQTR